MTQPTIGGNQFYDGLGAANVAGYAAGKSTVQKDLSSLARRVQILETYPKKTVDADVYGEDMEPDGKTCVSADTVLQLLLTQLGYSVGKTVINGKNLIYLVEDV